MKQSNAQSGFTLVELAIVLVIIGLIIGGVLVGQDMIKSAEIRATISQYEKYNTAVNAFRGKYGGFPGDLQNATNFGFSARQETPGAGVETSGNGNGLLVSCTTASPTFMGCETATFFEDMSIANMIQDSITAGALADATHTNGAATTTVTPVAEMGGGTVWQVYSTQGRNWYHLGGTDDATAGPAIADTITPIDAFNIDDKVDDADPSSGVVVAVSDRATVDTVTTGTLGHCKNAATTYNTDEATAGESITPSCSLMLRMN